MEILKKATGRVLGIMAGISTFTVPVLNSLPKLQIVFVLGVLSVTALFLWY